VVIGRNEEAQLDRCFTSVKQMNFPAEQMELLYIDSDSSDSSREIARRHGARVIHIGDQPLTAARGREVGWRASSAPFILFLDGDCAVEPDFVARGLGELNDDRVAVVCGAIREQSPDDNFYQKMNHLLFRALPLGSGLLRGGNHLCCRSALEAVDGYRVDFFTMESAELGRRLRRAGYLILRVDLPMVVHDLAMSRFAEYYRRGFRNGYGDVNFLLRVAGAWRVWQHVELRERILDVLSMLATVVLIGAAGYAFGLRGMLLAMIVALLVLLATKLWRVRKKSGDVGELLLYGVHSQLLAIFGLAGYLCFVTERLLGRQRGVIDWKSS
jgi:cellulose synthase/poly-beta-1,6-N-acetylglucosamine synthase-like glycosyltransferase